MKKKFLKHAIELAKSLSTSVRGRKPAVYTYDDRLFVLDDHRVLEIESGVEGLEMAEDEGLGSICKYNFDVTESREYDYQAFQLPTLKEIKDGIREAVGRKRTAVAYTPDLEWAVNARYLAKAMEALNATTVYVSARKPATSPLVLFMDDDLQSTTKELILPIRIGRRITRSGFTALA